jgi:hypothetical protein
VNNSFLLEKNMNNKTLGNCVYCGKSLFSESIHTCTPQQGQYHCEDSLDMVKHGEPTRHELQAKGEHPAPCARFCEATAFWITERGLKRRIEQLEAKLSEAEKQEKGEPVAYMRKDMLQKASQAAVLCEVSPDQRQDRIGIYTKPQPLDRGCCAWKQHNDTNMPDTWEADCGAMWTFNEGGPKANDMKFCPNCGKPTIEADHGVRG